MAAVGYGGYLLWRLLTFHSLVPNTSVKLYPLLIEQSAGQFFEYVLYVGGFTLALPILGLRDERQPRAARRRLGLLVLVVGMLSVVFHFAAGGNYRSGFRYLVPTLPLVLVAIWCGFERLTAGRTRASRLLSSTGARVSLLALVLYSPLVALWQHPPHIHDWGQQVFAAWRDPFSDDRDGHLQIINWMVVHVPPNSVVAFGQMGKVPYFLAHAGHNVTFIDTLGLVDRQVSQVYRVDTKLRDLFREIRSGRTLTEALTEGRLKRAHRMVESILARHPDFILIETALADFQMMKVLLESPELAAAYRPIDGLPYFKSFVRAD